jgi:hypothetical protein
MADTTLKAELVVDVSMGMLRGDSKVRSAVESLFDNAVGVGLIRGVKGSSRALQTEMFKVIAHSMKAGSKPAAQELYKAFKSGSKEIVSARQEMARIDRQLINETDQAHRKRLQGSRQALDDEVRRRTKLLKDTQKTVAKETERMADVLKDAGKSLKDSISEGAESLNAEVEKITGQDFGEGFGKAKKVHGKVKGFGQQAQSMGGRMGKIGKGMGGRMGGALQSGGKMMAMAGAATAAAAGVVAAVVGLGIMFKKVYDWSKGMNKALLDNVASADLWSDAMNRGHLDMNRMAGTLRDTATDMAYDWRMQSEEVIGLMRAVNDAGLTFKELQQFSGGLSFRDAVQDTAEMVLIASKNLGIGYQEAGEYADRMMRDFGMGIDGVTESFAKVFVAAQGSGMAVKSFFTAVNEASSGMALYNFRLDDTLGLLLLMTEVLGEDMAKQQLGLQGQFKNMGMQERTKTAMTTGVGRTQSILKADAEAQARTFTEQFGHQIAQLGGTGMISSMGQLDAGAVGSMSEKDFRNAIGKLREGEGNEAMARNLENIRQLAQGTGGGALGAAAGMGGLSRSGEMAMQLAQASAVLGAPISEMEGMDRMAFEEITGQSGENFEILQRLDRQFRYEYEQAGGAEGTGSSFFEFVGSGQFADQLEQAASEAQDPMRRLAEAQLKETTSVVQTLKNIVGIGIDNVASGIDTLYRHFTRYSNSETDEMKASKVKKETMEARLRELTDIQSADRTMGATSTGSEAARIQGELETRAQQIQDLRNAIREERDVYTEMAGGEDEDDARQRAGVKATGREMGIDPMTWVRSLFSGGKYNQGMQVARDAGIGTDFQGMGLDVDLGNLSDTEYEAHAQAMGWGSGQGRDHITTSMIESDTQKQMSQGRLNDDEIGALFNKGAVAVTLVESKVLTGEQLEAIKANHTASVTKMQTIETEQKLRDEKELSALKALRRVFDREEMGKLTAVTGKTQGQLARMKVSGGGISEDESSDLARRARDRYNLMNPTARRTGLQQLPMEWQAILKQYGVHTTHASAPFNDFVWDPLNGFQEYNASDIPMGPGMGLPGGPLAQGLAGAMVTVNNYINGTDEMNAKFGHIIEQVLIDSGVSRRPGPAKLL